jgi:hypothetical protein
LLRPGALRDRHRLSDPGQRDEPQQAAHGEHDVVHAVPELVDEPTGRDGRDHAGDASASPIMRRLISSWMAGSTAGRPPPSTDVIRIARVVMAGVTHENG